MRLSKWKSAVILAALLLAKTAPVFSQIVPFSFLQQPSFSITTTAQTLYPNVCSNAVTIQTNFGGKAKNPSSALTVNFATTGTLAVYSDTSCTQQITNTTIATSANTVTVYVMLTSVETDSLTVSGGNYKTVSQSETGASNPFLWTGAAGDGVWSTAGNWSNGTAAPGTSDVAVFDGTCTNCSANITSNISIGGIVMLSGYSGTITQNGGNTITFGVKGWVQKGGTFVGSSSGDAMTANGLSGSGGYANFYLTGGSFTSTSGTFGLRIDTGYLVYIGGTATFNHNGGTFYVSAYGGSSTINVGSAIFKNFYLYGNNGTITLTGTMAVDGTLTLDSLNGGYFNGGTVNLKGDLIVLEKGFNGNLTNSTNIQMVGSTNQKIDASAATVGQTPSITIASTGGTVSMLGSLMVNGNWIYSSGTVDPGTSTLGVYCGYAAISLVPGTINYNNVWLGGAHGSITLTGTLNVAGSTTFYSSNAYNVQTIGGTVNAKGDVIVSGYGGSGTMALKIVGSSNQKIDSSGASFPSTYYAQMPPITIASTGGTVTFVGNNYVPSTFTYTSGTMSFGTSSLNLLGGGTFTPGGQTYGTLSFISGTVTVAGALTSSSNVTLSNASGSGTVNMGTSGSNYALTVAGTLTVNSSYTLNMNGGTRTQGTLVNSGVINP